MKISLFILEKFFHLIYKDYKIDLKKFNDIGFEVKSKKEWNKKGFNDLIITLELTEKITLIDVFFESLVIINGSLFEVWSKLGFDNLIKRDEKLIEHALETMELKDLSDFGFGIKNGKIFNHTLYNDHACRGLLSIFYQNTSLTNVQAGRKELFSYELSKKELENVLGTSVNINLVMQRLNNYDANPIYSFDTENFNFSLPKKLFNIGEIMTEFLRICYGIIEVKKSRTKKDFLQQQSLINYSRKNLQDYLLKLGFFSFISQPVSPFQEGSLKIMNPISEKTNSVAQCLFKQHIAQQKNIFEFFWRKDKLYLEITSLDHSLVDQVFFDFLEFLVWKNCKIHPLSGHIFYQDEIIIERKNFLQNETIFSHCCFSLSNIINMLNDEIILLNERFFFHKLNDETKEFHDQDEILNFFIKEMKKNRFFIKNIYQKNGSFFVTISK